MKVVNDDDDITLDGRQFQIRGAAAAKERSQMVEQHVVRMTSELVIVDRRCRRDSSAVRRRLSVKYDRAWPCRQRKVRTASL